MTRIAAGSLLAVLPIRTALTLTERAGAAQGAFDGIGYRQVWRPTHRRVDVDPDVSAGATVIATSVAA
ncbi:hypothetical protein [Demequina lutea]|uniref:Uncharacterized protein n=1 Tax=Demequina lutea TaxID=431489 RepID=A0A7Y9ZC81_9MICO|nr:hypothetical protein [Demequina lutea]NYI42456.1 hypothetical protein [Demequina lutea]